LTEKSNKIVLDGYPIWDEVKIETAAGCYPGRLVKKGTTDGQAVVNTAAGMAMGWLGYEKTQDLYKPATVDTIYKVNDFASLVKGDIILVARLAEGESVARGDPLVAAANGELKKASAATVTIASGAVSVVSDKAQPDEAVVGAYGSEGPIVAYADETVDASAAAKDIKVRGVI